MTEQAAAVTEQILSEAGVPKASVLMEQMRLLQTAAVTGVLRVAAVLVVRATLTRGAGYVVGWPVATTLLVCGDDPLCVGVAERAQAAGTRVPAVLRSEPRVPKS